MKRNIALLIWLTSLNLIAQYPTATLKIGTVYNPQPDTILVPVTCEAIDNPIIGNNLISSWGWYIAYDTNVLYAGEPGTNPTLLNYLPEFPAADYLTWIFADNPAPGWNTIVIIKSCACSGEIYPGDKFFDIQFTYTEDLTEEPNIIWTSSPQGFETNLADDEGNEFLLTLIDGYVGPASNDVTFHVTGNGNDIAGAWVTVGMVTLPTNAEGIAVFSLPDGDYTYTVTKDGFAEEEGTFTVAGAPQLIEVEMEVCWDVTIHVVSVGGPLTGCIITIGDYVFNNDTTSSVCLPEGVYPLTITKEGYYPYNGSITVNGSPQIQNIILFPMSNDVTFFVNCCGQPLSGIPITIDGYTIITPVNGIIVLSLLPGSYSVPIGGYIFNFTIPGSTYIDANICRELTYLVTTEQGYPLENVLISMGTNYLLTDNNGEADTCLQVGSHSYSASKPGFVTQTGTVEMDTIPQTVEILMPLVTYPVSFNCPASCDNEFNGWWFSINGETMNPGETIYLPEGSYYTSCGYLDCTMPIYGTTYIQGPTTLSCFLIGFTAPHATFQISSSEGGNLQGATVMVDTFALITNYSGEASFCLPEGDHYYSISKEGYDTLTGIFSYIDQCEDTLVNILMNPVLVNEQYSSGFRLYPNPSSGKFSIENLNQTEEPTEIFVMDITGRLVYQTGTSTQVKTEFDLTRQPKGMYFIRVKTGEMVVNRKLIVK